MTRRDQGDGSIFQRNDGRWCARAPLATIDGKRRRKEFYGASKREVQQKLKAYLKAQEYGLLVVNERLTVGEYLQEWLDQIVTIRNKPSTLKSYSDTVRLYISPAIGHLKLAILGPEHVQRLLNDMYRSGLSARTVAYTRAVLRTALNRALKWGYIVRNSAALAEAPRQERGGITPLTEGQTRKFLQAVQGHRLEALYQVAIGLGLRRGELLALRWADVDLAEACLKVADGKTRSSRRTLPLSAVLVAALHQHWQLQQQERNTLGMDWKEHGLVFPSEVGTPIPGRNLVRQFKSVLKKAGLPDVRFHDLRHGCASFMIAQGVHPRVVMEMMGHTQIGTTMNIYGHVVSTAKKSAVEGLNSLFKGA